MEDLTSARKAERENVEPQFDMGTIVRALDRLFENQSEMNKRIALSFDLIQSLQVKVGELNSRVSDDLLYQQQTTPFKISGFDQKSPFLGNNDSSYKKSVVAQQFDDRRQEDNFDAPPLGNFEDNFQFGVAKAGKNSRRESFYSHNPSKASWFSEKFCHLQDATSETSGNISSTILSLDLINTRELNPLYQEDRPSIFNNNNRWKEEQLLAHKDNRTATVPGFAMLATGKCNIPNYLYTHIKTDMGKLWLSRQEALQQSPFVSRGQGQNYRIHVRTEHTHIEYVPWFRFAKYDSCNLVLRYFNLEVVFSYVVSLDI